MPLNIEVPTEHPDVTALKQKVIKVADQYTRTHGWCDVVNQALRDMGVKGVPGPRKINVEVTFTVEGVDGEQRATHRFDRESLADKTTEQQHEYVLEQIVTPSVVLGVQITPNVTIIDLNEAARTSRDGLEYPEGYVHVYTSREGRVAHLLRDPGVDDLRRWLRRGIHYAMCSDLMTSPVTESDRSEGRVCKKCLDRAESAAMAA